MNENQEHERWRREAEPRPGPRIYVASLSDYNAGRLHGRWLEADQPVEDLHEQTQDMLGRSSAPDAEEYAIHDHEGWHGWTPTEYEALGTIARVAAGISEHGPAFGHWIDFPGEIEEEAETRFESAFKGQWSSMRAYADELVEDMGVRITVEPEAWAHYVGFDVEALARDLRSELHIADDGDGGLYVFDPWV